MSLRDAISEALDALDRPGTFAELRRDLSLDASDAQLRGALGRMLRDKELRPCAGKRYALPWMDDDDDNPEICYATVKPKDDQPSKTPAAATPPQASARSPTPSAAAATTAEGIGADLEQQLAQLQARVRTPIADLDRKLAVLARLSDILDDSIGAVLTDVAADLKRGAA